LEVGHVDYTPAAGGISTQFTVDGAVTSLTTYNASNLPGSLSPSTVTVTTHHLTGHRLLAVSLWSLLNQAGIVTDPNIKNDILGKYVIATAVTAINRYFHWENSILTSATSDLVAYANGTGASLAAAGFARIVVPEDVGKGRPLCVKFDQFDRC